MGAQERLIDAASKGDLPGIVKAILDGSTLFGAWRMRIAGGRRSFNLALQLAAGNGHLDCVRALIPASDPKADESEALRLAAENGRIDCVRALISASDPKAGDSAALRFAAGNGHLDCVRELISVSEPKAGNSTALCWAAKNGRLDCVDELLRHCDPRARGLQGLTPVEMAVANGNLEVAMHIEAYLLAMEEAREFEAEVSAAKSQRKRIRL